MRVHPFERFDNLYIPEPNSGCWIWIGNLNNKGYGKFQLGRTGYSMVYAHRFSYETHHCKEIPKHMDLCHTCDITLCVNPDHLWIGTRQQNMADCLKKGRFGSYPMPGALNPKATITEEQATEILNSNEPAKVFKKRYNCSKHLVSKIRTGKTWKHLR